MEHKIHNTNGIQIIEITSQDLIINSAQDFLDVIANIPSNILILKKEMLNESFFDLRTGLAGEILQKMTNYFIRMAVVGDLSKYTSKSFKDFVFECSKRNQVVFAATIEEAVERLK